MKHKRFSVWSWSLIFVLAGVGSIFLRFLVQPYPIFEAIHDDFLLVKLANNIENTGWLGPWQLNTLSKGPGYSLFLSLTHFLPWAPTVTLQIMIVFAGYLFVVELFARKYKTVVVFLCFLFIVYFPIYFGWTFSRFYRDGLLTVLALIFTILVLRISRIISLGIQPKTIKNYIDIVVTALIAGMTLGAFFITKVSWQFLLFPIVSLVIISLIGLFGRNRTRTNIKFVPLALTLIALIAGASVFPSFVAIKNYRNYGVFVTDDFSQGGFSAAVTQMMRVQDTDRPEYVDVTSVMRQKIYSISSTARELQPFLETEPGVGWKSHSCQALNICNESGLWFPWELRDAAFAAGFADSPVLFQKKMYQISKDIEIACSQGSLDCNPPGLSPGLRSLTLISPRLFLDAYGNGLLQISEISSASFLHEQIKQPPEDVKKIWEETVSDIGNISSSTSSWNPGSRSVEGITSWLKSIYLLFWPIMFILGFASLFITQTRKFPQRNDQKILGFSFYVSGFVFLALMSVMEADGGMYLTAGGNLYLLCAYPLFMVGSVMGILNLFEYFQNTLNGKNLQPLEIDI